MSAVLKEFIVERVGKYQGVHSIDVTESNGLFYGKSEVDEGFQAFTTWYGQEMVASSNLDLRDDGFFTWEEAWAHVRARFNVVAVGGGYAVTKES